MDGAKIRSTFLKYFEAQGHTPVASSPLIPRNDPTLFFTNAGMVQFKNVFTGEEKRDYSRATTVQKCLRVSGKHNDLENVGVTPRHHTYFEMLGNFSFGDYFKRDAIRFAWDLLTNVYKLDGDKLWITVYNDDDEAFAIWRDEMGIPERKVVRLGEKDNFWAMGDTGPCGPCSEIHLDKQAQAGRGPNPAGILDDPEGYLEIWNLVFMQFERSAGGVLTPLPRPSIDTGMGLERLASILQGKQSNYDTDLFMPIIDRVQELCGLVYGADPGKDVSMRVIADHARATAFLVGDGVMPSNEERGYVLRRIMRRAIRHGVKLGLNEPFLFKAVERVIEMMAEAFPELPERKSFVLEVVGNEEQQFARTLDKGLRLYREQAETLRTRGEKTLPGDFAFRLSDTFGFPLDLTEIIASEDGLEVDRDGFSTEMERQREMARKAWKGSGEESVAAVYQQLRGAGLTSQFVGYDQLQAEARVLALVRGGSSVTRLEAGELGEVIVDITPFYGESGGQVGDVGRILLDGHEAFAVTDAQHGVEGLIVHRGQSKRALVVGDEVRLEVDAVKRAATRRNHSATHLLHAALRKFLGTHVAQRGSLVAPDRLRFDFSHFKPLSPAEIKQVEDWVNEGILQNIGLDISQKSMQDAVAAGAMALFGEKYGDTVRVIDIPGLSTELCGGTHVRRTGDIGSFKIVSESGIQAGVRRIEASTGLGTLELLRGQEDQLRELAGVLKVGTQEVPRRVQRLLDEKRDLEKQIEVLTRKLAQGGGAASVADRTRDIGGIKVISMACEIDDPKALREQADRLRDSLGSGVVILGARGSDKVTVLVAVTKDLLGRLHAGNIVKEVAKGVDGSGGGRPDLAQAGGKSPEKLDATLDAAFDVVQAML